MKKHLLTLSIILTVMHVFAQESRFWVNGSGNWSDKNHWSLSSGGEAGASIPDKNTSVVFDDKSFTTRDHFVVIKQNAYCRNLTAIDAVFAFKGRKSLSVSGSVNVNQNVDFQRFKGDINFVSQDNSEINLASKLNSNIFFDQVGGSWNLKSDLTTRKNIYLQKGYLKTNNQTVTCYEFNGNSSSKRALYLGKSQVNVNNWNFSESFNLNFYAEQSNLVFAGDIAPNFETASDLFYGDIRNGSSKASHTLVTTPTDATCPLNTTGISDDGSILAVVDGGVGTFNFVLYTNTSPFTVVDIKNGTNNVNWTGLKPGSYLVTAAVGASSFAANIVNVGPDDLIANIIVNSEALCYGGNIQQLGSDVTGGTTAYAYSWTDEFSSVLSTVSTLDNVAGGEYYLEVTDAKGCKNGDSFYYYPDFPDLDDYTTGPDEISINTVNTSATCQGYTTGEIAVTNVTGGTGAYQYAVRISGSGDPLTYGGSSTISSLAAGDYEVWVKDANNCEKEYASIVTIASTPAPTADAGTDASSCKGSTYTFAPGQAGATNYSSVLWTSSGTGVFSGETTLTPSYTPSVDDETAGSVVLTLTAYGNGTCDPVTDNMTLTFKTVPTPNAGIDGSACGKTFSFNGTSSMAGSSVTWSLVSGAGTVTVWNPSANIVGVNLPIVTVSNYGAYIFQLTETKDGCTGFDQVNVSFIQPAQVSAGSNATVCGTNTHTLSTSSASNYSSLAWTTSGTGTFDFPDQLHPIYTPSSADRAAGTVNLTLTATGNSPCGSVGSTLTLTLKAQPTPNAGLDDNNCGTHYLLNGTRSLVGTTLSWSTVTRPTGGVATFTGGTTEDPSVDVTLFGTYEFRFREANGTCVGTDDVKVVFNDAAMADAGTNASICAGSTYTLSNSSASNYSSLAWTTSGTGTFDHADQLHPIYTPSANDITTGSVTLTLTAVGLAGCPNYQDGMLLTINPVPVAATSASATATTICEGQSTIISYSGGSGTTFKWYSGSCGGTFVGTGNNLSVSPVTTTTYYGRWETPTCGNSTCVNITIDVNPLPVAATSASATLTTICAGDPTILSYTGGSGTTFRWYTGSCGGTLAGTGNNLTVSPAVTTTYYGRWENGCGNSSCVTVTINVNPLPVAATSASATSTTICEGETTTLSYSGGSGTTFGWYTGSCGGTLAGTGNNLVVSPVATTTYYGRWETPTCGNSTCVTVTITVNPLPVAPTSVTADNLTICAGSPTILSYTGGSGTTFGWYTGSCGGTSVGTGNNLSVSPLVTTTYYGRWENGCGNSTCQSVTINVNPLPVAATSASATSTTICEGETTTLSYSGGSGTTFGWYTGSCGGTLAGTGNNLVVSPVATTTYYGRWETPTCGNSTCVNITIDVNPLPVAATSASATLTTICAGDPTILSYTGGSGTTFTWYTGSCGGTSVGTGNNLTVSPITTTTYYGRWETATCGNSTCVSVTINVNPLPVQPTSVTATATIICAGQSTTLTYTGGSGTTFGWYTESCGGTSVGTGNNLTVSPAVTTTYYGRWENGCGNSACKTVTVTVNPVPTPNAGADDDICDFTYTLDGTRSLVGSTLAWTPVSGAGSTNFAPANGEDPILTVTAGGPYVLRLTETKNGCTGSDDVKITFVPSPTADAGSDAGICAGADYAISDATAANYSSLAWTTSGTGSFDHADQINPTYTPSGADITAGSVVLKLTANGNVPCLAATPSTMTLTIHPLPVPVISGNNNTCLNSTETYSTDAGMSNYIWSVVGGTIIGSSTSQTVDVQWTSGGLQKVSVTYTDSHNCNTAAATDYTVTVNDLPTSGLLAAYTACTSQDLALDGSPSGGSGTYITHLWSDAGALSLDDVNSQTPIFNNSLAGIYNLTYTVTDDNGCVGSKDITITNSQGPVANAGSDATICYDGSYQVTDASASDYTSIKWTTAGNGTFDFDNILNPVYTPGAADKTAGSVVLTLRANSATCGFITDNMTLTLAPELVASIGGESPYLINLATTKIEVSFWGYHENVKQLGFYLLAPDGVTQVRLFQYSMDAACAGPLSNKTFDNLTFSNQSVTNFDICSFSALPTISGTYAAKGSWAAIDGLDPAQGGWSLKIVDNNYTKTGTLYQAKVTFTDINVHTGLLQTITFDSKTINEPISDNSTTTYVVPIGLRTNCYGACDAHAIVNVTGGTAPYVSYEWSNPLIVGTDEVNLCGGDYQVTVTDAMGCQSVATVSVLEPDPIVLTPEKDDVKCFGASTGRAKVTASDGLPPYEYLWDDDNNSITDEITGLAAGIYTVIVTDANHCTAITSITIDQPAAKITSVADITPTNCNSATGKIIVTPAGGTPFGVGDPYLYHWTHDPLLVGNTADNLAVNTYPVQIEDANGCVLDTSFTMIDNGNLVISDFKVIAPVLCNGDCNGEIEVEFTGGTGAYDYAWSEGGVPVGANQVNLDNVCGGHTYDVLITDQATTCSVAGSYEVPQPEVVAVTITEAHDALCNGESTGTARAHATGGSGNYIYTWRDAASNVLGIGADISNLPAGQVFVDAVDENGCSASANTTIGEPAVLVLTPSSTLASCATSDGTASVSVTGGTPPYNYQWDDPAASATASITGLASGVYHVIVTDFNNCQAFDLATVNENNTIVITLDNSTDALCHGSSDGTADITVTGATGIVTYAWSSGETNQNATQLTAGANFVTVTDDNSCSKILQVDINEPTVLTATHTTTNPKCIGNANGFARIFPAGGTAPYQVKWFDGQTVDQRNDLLAGNYTVTVTDAHGCETTDAFTLTDPEKVVVTFDITKTNCGDETGEINIVNTTGGAEPYEFHWTHPSWPSEVLGTTVSNVGVGIYNLQIIDANTCVTDTFAIMEDNSDLALAISSVTNVNCHGDATGGAVVAATGGTGEGTYTYSWDNGTSGPEITGVVAGDYPVTVTDGNGCQKVLVVSITEPDAIQNNIVYTQSIVCAGDQTASFHAEVTGGVEPYAYQWKNQNGGVIGNDIGLDNVSVGSYYLTITDFNGCAYTDQVDIVEPAPLISDTETGETACPENATGWARVDVTGGAGGYTYHWESLMVPGGFVPGNDQARIDNLIAGFYAVTVTDGLGCQVTDMAEVLDNGHVDFDVEVLKNISCIGSTDGSAQILNPVDDNGPLTNYTVSWSNGEVGDIATQLGVGTNLVTVTSQDGCKRTRIVEITDEDALAITGFNHIDDWSVSGDCMGSAEVLVSGGIGGYNYSWSTTETTASISGLCQGQYDVTVTDNNPNGSCQVTGSVTISKSLLNYQITEHKNVSCNGGNDGALTVSAVGGAPGDKNYQWAHEGWSSYPEADSLKASITNLTAGRYYFTITEADGSNSVSSFVVVTEPDVIDVTYHIDPTECAQSTGSITIDDITGGTEPYEVVWSHPSWTGQPDSTRMKLENIGVDIYTLTITDFNNCQFVKHITMFDNSDLALNIESITDVTCYGAKTGAALVSATGGTGNYTYTWNGFLGTNQITDTLAGYYLARVTDENGCSRVAEVVINQPEQFHNQFKFTQPLVCAGDNIVSFYADVTGGTPDYTYVWKKDGNLVDDADNYLEQVGLGTYSLLVLDGNGCEFNDAITIQTPDSIKPVITPTATVCGDSTATANVVVTGGQAPYTYHWYPVDKPDTLLTGYDQPHIEGLWVGLFEVRVTDILGCSVVKQVEIFDNGTVDFTVNILKNVSCVTADDGSAEVKDVFNLEVGLLDNYQVKWDNGETSVVAEHLTIGLHWVMVISEDGCRKIKYFEITNEDALRIKLTSVYNNTNGVGQPCNGSVNVTVKGGVEPYYYKWSTGDEGFDVNEITKLCQGWYYLTLTDANPNFDCEVKDSFLIIQDTLRWDTVTLKNVSCYNSNDGFIEVTGVGGYPGGYNYKWSNPQWTTDSTNASVSNLVAGWYYFTISEKNSINTVHDSIEVLQPAKYNPRFTIDSTHCYDSIGSIAINELISTGGTKPFSYAWSYPDWTQDSTRNIITNLWVDDYRLKVTDANGCETDTVVSIPDINKFKIEVLNVTNPKCFDSNEGSIEVTGASEPTDIYSYEWNNGNSNQKIENLIAGKYFVTVTNSMNCELIDSFTLVEPDPITFSITNVVPNTCYSGNDGHFIMNPVTGGNPGEYLYWIFDEQDIVYPGHIIGDSLKQFIPTGKYKLMVSDSKGCNSTKVDFTYLSAIPQIFGTFEVVEQPNCAGLEIATEKASENGRLKININPGYFNQVSGTIDDIDANYIQYVWDNRTATNSNIGSNLNVGIHSVNVIFGLGDQTCISTFETDLQPRNMFEIKDDEVSIYYKGKMQDTMYVCSSDTIQLVSTITADSLVWTSSVFDSIYRNVSPYIVPDSADIYNLAAYSDICMDKSNVIAKVFQKEKELDAHIVDDKTKVFVGNEVQLLVNEIKLLPFEEKQFEYSVNYYWGASGDNTWVTGPDTISPTSRPLESLIYKVLAKVDVTGVYEDTLICNLSDTVSVEVFPEFNPPGAFTPNGDGYNDVWNLPGVQGFTSISIQIFNRWGGTIWKSDKYEPWDGNNTKGKAAPSGTYYYIIKYGDDKGTKTLTGSVTILR